jgi:hypothetical protein
VKRLSSTAETGEAAVADDWEGRARSCRRPKRETVDADQQITWYGIV